MEILINYIIGFYNLDLYIFEKNNIKGINIYLFYMKEYIY